MEWHVKRTTSVGCKGRRPLPCCSAFSVDACRRFDPRPFAVSKENGQVFTSASQMRRSYRRGFPYDEGGKLR